MLKIILDTNVIVSSLIQKSFPYQIVNDIVLEKKVKLCLSQDLLDEYTEVLSRPKFSRFPEFIARAEFFIEYLNNISVFYKPNQKVNLISDVKDNVLLELALASEAHYIVTGNSNDFNFEAFNTTKIVSPKVFWEAFQQQH